MLGGDTDTNGAIVGGLIGALVGIRRIPEYMIDKILCFDNNGN
jgi:ADP-ribosylglycohydrolase